MPEAQAVVVPLLNPNEPEAVLAGVFVKDGQPVKPNDPIAAIETTKSAVDILADREGFVRGLRKGVGDWVRAGEKLCWLADAADWSPPSPSAGSDEPGLPKGLRITQPALALALEAGLDLGELERGPLLTEREIRSLISTEPVAPAALEGSYDPKALVVYGGGGHGKSLIELVRALDTYELIGVVDDGMAMESRVLGLPVVGGVDSLQELAKRGIRQAVNAVGGVGDVRVRVQVFGSLHRAGFVCPSLVHPRALVEPSASLADGTQIFPFAYVGSEVEVGYGSIVNTGAIVSHDCVISDYVNVAPGAILAGGVAIGPQALVGMGVTVNLGVHIGAHARIGNGATVKQDVPDRAVVHAGSVWPSRG